MNAPAKRGHIIDSQNAPPAMSRLAASSLDDLPPDVVVPGYDRSAKSATHAHVGVGNFHRAHQAVYVDDLLKAGAPKGAIVGFSMRSRRVIEALTPQDLLYTVAEASRDGLSSRVVGSLREMVFVPADPRAAVARLADPSVEVVTITVTEAGYCWSDEMRSLDMTHPDLVHDIEHPDTPHTMPGLILAALAHRLEQRLAPFVVVPCDNIVDNGTVTHTLLTQLAAARSSALERYVDSEVYVCSTMVDRMVPTTTNQTLDIVSRRLGAMDASPILTEPFRQWVVEDSRVIRHWAEAGVELVADTAPWERLKLQVLNGIHSALAYLGLRLGHAAISEAVADRRILATIERIIDTEIAPSVLPPAGTDPARYAARVLNRFAEPALGYTTHKVATDGTLKLQQRVLPTLRTCLEAGRSIDGLALIIAAWGWIMFGPDRTALAVADAGLDHRLGDRPRTSGPAGFVSWVFSEDGLLADLADSPRLRTALEHHAICVWEDPPQIDIGRS